MRIQKAGKNSKVMRVLEPRIMLDASLAVAGEVLVENATAEIGTDNLDYSSHGGPAWAKTGWDHRQKITIDADKVDGTGTLDSYVMLITGANMSAEFWGEVNDANGYDIVFTDTSGTELAREVVSFDSVAKTMEVHVKLEGLSGSTDTDIYMYYGGAAQGEMVGDVWTDYEAVWHLESDASDSDTGDGSTYNGTMNGGAGGPSSTAGMIGGGMDFNSGSKQYIEFGDEVGNFGTSNFSYSFWYQADTGANQSFLAKSFFGTGGDRWSSLFYGGSHTALFTESNETSHNTTTSIETGAWHHMTVTYENGGDITIYVDGEFANSNSAGTYDINTDYLFLMGAYNDNTDGTGVHSSFGYLNGQMDEVTLHMEDRSAEWIKTTYNNQSDAAGFYSLDGGQETYKAAADVTYNVTSGPGAGTLFLDGNDDGLYSTGEETASFTQADIDAGNVYYVNTSDTATADSITFDVEGITAQTLNLSITAVNDAPTDLTLGSTDIDENSAGSTVIGALSATDVDSGAFTYSIVGGSDKFQVNGSNLEVKAGANLDHETADQVSLTIRADDGAGGTYDKLITIDVNDVAEAPTEVSLSATDIAENVGEGAEVATLSVTDADDGDVHTYVLHADASGKFEIVGNKLKLIAGESLDFETQNSFALTIRVNDGTFDYDQLVSVNVTDVLENVQTAGEGSDGPGDQQTAANQVASSPSVLSVQERAEDSAGRFGQLGAVIQDNVQSGEQILGEALAVARNGKASGYSLISATIGGTQQEAFYGADLQEVLRGGNTHEAARATMSFGYGGGHALDRDYAPTHDVTSFSGNIDNIIERGDLTSGPQYYEPAGGDDWRVGDPNSFVDRFLEAPPEGIADDDLIPAAHGGLGQQIGAVNDKFNVQKESKNKLIEGLI